MKEITVSKKYDGKKLYTVLLNTFDALSVNTLYKALRKKDIRVNDVKVSQNVVVHEGDNIKVYISDEYLFFNVPDIPIIYEDENILIVNKPVGIEVDNTEFSLTEVLMRKKEYSYDWLCPCHRLDRNTNGLVLFAKTPEVATILLGKFKNREIEKIYHAKVYGIPKEKEKLLSAYLFKDRKKSMVYISDVPKKGYVKIATSYKVLESNVKDNTSLLEVNLLTGKTHQIRAHLAHIGYPIIGDGKYGNNKINKKFKCSVQQLTSYSIAFNFTTPAGILEYLNGKCYK